jgi:phage terminase large subunit-like protein
LPWLLRAGFSEQFVKDHFVEFGQGMQSMSPALGDLEQVLLEGELAHGDHPILSMCVSHNAPGKPQQNAFAESFIGRLRMSY